MVQLRKPLFRECLDHGPRVGGGNKRRLGLPIVIFEGIAESQIPRMTITSLPNIHAAFRKPLPSISIARTSHLSRSMSRCAGFFCSVSALAMAPRCTSG